MTFIHELNLVDVANTTYCELFWSHVTMKKSLSTSYFHLEIK